MEMPRWMGWIILFILILLCYVVPIRYAWKKKHPHRKLITFLIFCAPLGYMIAMMILLWRTKRTEEGSWLPRTVDLKLGDPDVYQCPNCGSPYRLQDYKPDVTIVCGVCKMDITRPAVI